MSTNSGTNSARLPKMPPGGPREEPAHRDWQNEAPLLVQHPTHGIRQRARERVRQSRRRVTTVRSDSHPVQDRPAVTPAAREESIPAPAAPPEVKDDDPEDETSTSNSAKQDFLTSCAKHQHELDRAFKQALGTLDARDAELDSREAQVNLVTHELATRAADIDAKTQQVTMLFNDLRGREGMFAQREHRARVREEYSAHWEKNLRDRDVAVELIVKEELNQARLADKEKELAKLKDKVKNKARKILALGGDVDTKILIDTEEADEEDKEEE